MPEQEVQTLDFSQLSAHQRRLLTPESIEEVLTYKQLQTLAGALGMKAVGVQKEELQSALLFAAAQLAETPDAHPGERTVRMRANLHFHDGNIAEGFGLNWNTNEVREVPYSIHLKLLESGGTRAFEVFNG